MAPTTSVDQQLARLAGPALLAGGLVQFDEMVQAAMAGDGPFVAPPPHAIAHHLMQWWIEQ